MYTIILSISIGAVIGLIMSISIKGEDKIPIWAAVGTLSFFSAMIGSIIASGISKGEIDNMVVVKEYSREKIRALEDNINGGGSFFLGSGSIEGKHYYYYYEEMSNGGYKSRKIEASNATVFEDQDSLAYVSKVIVDLPEDNSLKNWCFTQSTTHIHVPKGSITHKFNMDLK